jgi:hypothetical protein
MIGRLEGTVSAEEKARRELIHRFVDIGYKALAKTMHPDLGGSQEDMARLNHVRDRLKGV